MADPGVMGTLAEGLMSFADWGIGIVVAMIIWETIQLVRGGTEDRAKGISSEEAANNRGKVKGWWKSLKGGDSEEGGSDDPDNGTNNDDSEEVVEDIENAEDWDALEYKDLVSLRKAVKDWAKRAKTPDEMKKGLGRKVHKVKRDDVKMWRQFNRLVNNVTEALNARPKKKAAAAKFLKEAEAEHVELVKLIEEFESKLSNGKKTDAMESSLTNVLDQAIIKTQEIMAAEKKLKELLK